MGCAITNNSITISPKRILAALRSFEEPIFLSLDKLKHLVLFGHAAPIIEQAAQTAKSKIYKCTTLGEASGWQRGKRKQVT